MREIKFRAWDKKGKQMVNHIEKLLFTNDCLDTLVSAYDLEVKDGQNSGIYNRKFEHIELMQFTGLKDKNGKEIYEGDIIQYDFLPEGGDQRAEVVYEGRSFCLKNGGNSYMPHQDRMEIIGNIYKNPELLK